MQNTKRYAEIVDKSGDVLSQVEIEKDKSKLRHSTEISTYQSPYFVDSYFNPYNPDDLVQKKGYEVFEKMQHDEQVKVAFELKKRIILSKGWDIIPAKEDENLSIEQAEFIGYVLEDGYDGLFDMALEEILSAMQYGFSVTEKLYKIIPKGEYANKIGLKTLKTRPPHSIEFHLDKKGNILKDGLQQWQPDGVVSLPQDKFIVYSYRPKFGNPYGQSDFRDAYRSWFVKDKLIRFEAIYLERHGNPLITAQYVRGVAPDTQDDILTILKNLQAKTVARIPADVEITMHEVKKNGEKAFELAISSHNTYITRAFLLPELLGFTDRNTGSLALGKEQFNLFFITVESWQKQIEDLVNERLIKDLIDFNYSNVSEYPKIKFKPLSESDKSKLYEIWLKALKEGAVKAIEEDEKFLREELGFPIRTKDSKPVNEPLEPETPGIIPKKEDVKDDIDDDKKEKDIKKKEIKEPEVKAASDIYFATETKKFSRSKTEYENKVSFSEIENEFDVLANVMATDLSIVVKRIENTMLSEIEDKKIIENQRFDLAAKMNIKPKQKEALVKTFQKNYNRQFRTGRNTAKGELKSMAKFREDNKQYLFSEDNTEFTKIFKEDTSIGTFTPVEAIDYLQNKAIDASRDEDVFITKNTRTLLVNGMKNGKTESEIVFELEEFFDNYKMLQKTPQGEIARIEDIPGRLNTVVRTNLSDSYNQGRLAMYNNKDVRDFISAMQYSSIIDQNTTDFCRSYDKKIYKANDPFWNSLTPPNHFNCRSVTVPVLSDETYKESNKLAIQQPVPFGGSQSLKKVTPKKPKPTQGVPAPPKKQTKPIKEKPVKEGLKGKEWADTLGANERKVVNYWQGSGYENIREIQKTGKGSASLKSAIKDLDKALDRSEGYGGDVWRGLNNLNSKDFKKIANSTELKWDALTSSAKDEAAAARFLRGEKGKSVMLRIRNKSGVDITPIVGKEEAEVLLRKGTKYKVVNSAEKVFTVGKDKVNALEMILEEI